MKIGERLAKLPAFLDVSQHVFQSARRLRQRHRRIAAAFEIERLHQFGKTACWHDDVTDRHLHIVEIDIRRRHTAKTHQQFGLAEGQTWRPLFDQHRADALCTGCLRQTRVNQIGIAMAATRTPALRPVERNAVAFNHPARRQVGKRRPRAWF